MTHRIHGSESTITNDDGRTFTKRYRMTYTIEHGGHRYPNLSAVRGSTEIPRQQDCVRFVIRQYVGIDRLEEAIQRYEEDGFVEIDDGERRLTEIGYDLCYWGMVWQP